MPKVLPILGLTTSQSCEPCLTIGLLDNQDTESDNKDTESDNQDTESDLLGTYRYCISN